MTDAKANFERNKAWAKPPPYETVLNPVEEDQFRQWVDQDNVPFNPDEKNQDYDMRGFFKAMRDGRVKRDAQTQHFPDTFKTPYHETFSNESQYATHDAPRWKENQNKLQLIDKEGNVVFQEP